MDDQQLRQELAEEKKKTEWYRSRYEALRMDNEKLRLRIESVELDYLRSSSWRLAAPVRKLSALLHRQPERQVRDVSPLTQVQAVKRDPELQRLIDSHGEELRQPLVTVVMPVSPEDQGAEEALLSLRQQDWPELEILAAPYGGAVFTSPDARCLPSAASFSDALNAAIAEARGDYLVFQLPGMPSLPHRITESVHTLESENADVLWALQNEADLSSAALRIGAARRIGGFKPLPYAQSIREFFLRLKECGFVLHQLPAAVTTGGPLALPADDTDLSGECALLPVHRPKIAYVIPGCGISGGIAVVCQHANRLEKRGYEVLLLTESGEREIRWFPRQHVPVLPFEDAPDDIDIVVATSWSTAFTALHYPRGRKCYFVQSNEIRFFPQNSHEAYMARLSYCLPYVYITEALWIRDWLRENYQQNAVYVPNGIDETLIHRCEKYSDRGPRLRVLLEGSISSPFKGMKDAFAAVDGLDCEVWCVSVSGEPEPGWHCDKFIRRAAIHEMKYIYSSCDILLKMSRVEGFFGPPMEMMACGGVSVVGKVTGYDEYIVDEENALVVETGDVDGARKALQRLINDPALMEKLRANGKKTAEQWGWDGSINTLEQLYNRLYREMDDIRTQY